MLSTAWRFLRAMYDEFEDDGLLWLLVTLCLFLFGSLWFCLHHTCQLCKNDDDVDE